MPDRAFGRRRRKAAQSEFTARLVERRQRESPDAVIIQRRAQAARHARASASAVRVGVLLCMDLLVLSVDYTVADILRSSWSPFRGFAQLLVELVPRGTLPRYEVLFAVILGLVLFGNYRPGPFRRSAQRLFAASSLGLSMVFWSAIWDGISLLGIVGFFLALLGLGSTLRLGRAVVDYFVNVVRPTPALASRAIVIGSPEQAEAMRASPHVRKDIRAFIVGWMSPTARDTRDAIGSVHDLVAILDRFAIDTVMIAEHLETETLLSVLDICDRTGCTVISASPLLPAGGFIPRVVTLGCTPFVELYRPSLRAPQLAAKRVFDMLVAAVLLLILSPLLLLIAVLVPATSRGPAIFSQDRIGYAGRRFRMHKFRTMIRDAESQRAGLAVHSVYSDGRVFKIRNDPRVTRLGRLLRRTSIDELPQLWNVLRGDMSLVGPRPPLPDEVELYEERHYSRFDMKPGITGPWQVAGRNEITNFDDIIALDTAYLTDWTIAKDFFILLKTLPVVLQMRGAI